MSLEIIQKQITKFLSTPTPEVLAIKGKWGVGKTYAWNKFLAEVNQLGSLALEHYSYVSLFGVNSLDNLKQTIFENSVKKSLIGQKPSISTLQTNALEIGRSFSAKSLKHAKKLPYINKATSVIDSLSFLYLNDHVVCIDDFERKGKNIESNEIMGLISLLKEQKQCKVVLLLNDSDESKLKGYSDLKEKVIDQEIEFSPSSEESVEIAIDTDMTQFEYFKKCVISLDITNIRIIKKAEKLVNESLKLPVEIEEEVQRQIVHSTVLFVASHNRTSQDKDIPPLTHFTRNNFEEIVEGENTEDEDQTKAWDLTQGAYGFGHCDEIDMAIMRYVKSGYINTEEFIELIKTQNQYMVSQRNANSFSKAWELYHDSFDDNLDEVNESLYQSAKSSIDTISIKNLSSTIEFLRDSNELNKANELIDDFISQRSAHPEGLNIDEINVFGDKLDADLVNKCDVAYQRLKEPTSIKDSLIRIASSRSWYQQDVDVLTKATADEYYDLFKSEKGRKLTAMVSASLKYGAVKEAETALKKIAGECDINRRRIEHKYNITI